MKHLNKIVILFLLGAVALMYFYCCGTEDITQGKYVEGKVVNVAYEHYGNEYYGTVELCNDEKHVCRYVFYRRDLVVKKDRATSKDTIVLVQLKKFRNSGFVYVSELKLKSENAKIDKMEITEELTNKIPFDSHGYTHDITEDGNHNIWHINRTKIDLNNNVNGHLLVNVYPKGHSEGQNEIQMYIVESDVLRDTLQSPLEFYESTIKIREIIIGLLHEH